MAKQGIRIKFHRVRKINGLEIVKPKIGRHPSRPEIHVTLNTRRHEARVEQQKNGDAKVSIYKSRGGEEPVHTVVCDRVEMLPMEPEDEDESDQ